jgi:beta-lactamase superfamily II metal-dependent hydrolase
MAKLHILDVGHGNSAVLDDTECVTVVDTGLGSDLLQFLIDNSLTTIDTILLSHADSDHIGGVIALLSSGKLMIKNVYVNTDSEKKSDIWDDLLAALQDQDDRGKVNFKVGLTKKINGEIKSKSIEIEVLAPNQYLVSKGPGSVDRKKRKITTNSISAVISLNHGGKRVAILPGDLDMVGLQNLEENVGDIGSWLVVFPHHGGLPGSGNPAVFAQNICTSFKPEIVVFSVGNNSKDFPNAVVVQTIAKNLSGTRMLSTRSSQTLINHINATKSIIHQNCTGEIVVTFGKYPPEITWKNIS